MEGIAGEMRACWLLGRQEVIGASPLGGPDGEPAVRDTFGGWSSPEENGVPRPRAPSASPAPSSVRFYPRHGAGAAPQASPTTPPDSGWNSRIAEVMGKGEVGSSAAPLEGWFHKDDCRGGNCRRSASAGSIRLALRPLRSAGIARRGGTPCDL